MAVTVESALRAAPDEPVATREGGYPPAGQAWYCVFALALAVMINFLDRGILTLLVEPIKRDLQLTDVQMSLIMGFAFTFFYAVLGLPVARLVDRKSRKLIMTAGITIWSVMTMLCGMATNFWHLFFARMGLGVGETTSGPSAYSLLSDYFPPHRLPRAISFMQIGFVLGTGLSLILGAWIIDFVAAHPDMSLPVVGQLRGWQMVLMLVGLPGLVVAAIMASVREPPRMGGAQTRPTPIAEIFKFLLRHKLVFLPIFVGMGSALGTDVRDADVGAGVLRSDLRLVAFRGWLCRRLERLHRDAGGHRARRVARRALLEEGRARRQHPGRRPEHVDLGAVRYRRAAHA